MQSTLNFNPAENLMFKQHLDGGWTVIRKMPRQQGSTGGHFSVGYEVCDNSGNSAFLKAIDFSVALSDPDPITVLQHLTTAYNYERTLLEECRSRKLDRVAVSIEDGQIPAGDLHHILPVPYLIFELAEGDIRRQLTQSTRFELAFVLRALHHCATGIRQLHNIKVAHQDLKPSNVLVFQNSGCRVSDLGRSSSQSAGSPIDNLGIAGDLTYAPPELLYGEVSIDWQVRRFACDLYHLGNLAIFFFTKVGISALWRKYLDRTLWPETWGDSYRKVLPHIRDAHDKAFQEFESRLPDQIRFHMGQAVRQLCEPDPLLRGHPRTRAESGSPYSLQRYVSMFDLLARKAEWHLRAHPQ